MADIRIEGLCKRFGDVTAVSDVDLEIRDGEFFTLLGPSGCGKSTLLYLIGGFLPVETGAILIDGKKVAGPGPDRGIVFQHFALFPWKTVRGNILYGLERQGMAKQEREKRTMDFIELVGLSGFDLEVVEYVDAPAAARGE